MNNFENKVFDKLLLLQNKDGVIPQNKYKQKQQKVHMETIQDKNKGINQWQ